MRILGRFYSVESRIRSLERATPYPERRRRRRAPGPELRAGPRLIRGLGLARRHRNVLRPLRWLVYLALSAAIVSFVVRTWVLPVIR